MKKILLKILKVFLVLLFVILTILLAFAVALLLDWPWWMGFFLLLGLLGLVIGIWFLRRLWRKKREQHFVDEIIAQDESRVAALSGKEKEQLQELQSRWKEAVDSLRSSHLRKSGNPLYVLPWYLVIGESGSGKTTAIESARLSSPFAEMSRTSGISGTKNCDWWFFDQAIIIDTAGRYAIPIDEGRDKDEWKKFLGLLSKYRKKEPLNGLIVTVAADKLLESDSATLEEDGKAIRRRIDELMRVLGAKSPVYLLVTKCDLVQGMTQFCDQLPEQTLGQAMGAINHDLSKDVASFTSGSIKTIGDRLRDLRLLLLHRTDSRTLDPALLLFPEEFQRVQIGFDAFIKGAFQENPYQETPLLRGAFFSSGRQEGTPYSHFLHALGLIAEKDVLPGTNKGLFLHDFFARILPRDRRLFAPTQRALEWSRLTKNLGLTAYIALVLAICGVLSFSFVKNLRVVREVRHQFEQPPLLRGEIVEDVITMDRFQKAVVDLSERNKSWWIPRLGLNESRRVETELKTKYRNQFRDGFLASFDEQMQANIAKFSPATSDEVIGNHVTHLVRRINLLKTRIQGGELETLRNQPQPSYDPIVVQADQAVLPEVREMFGGLYLYYLVWGSDTSKMNQEMIGLQKWLSFIVTEKRTDLNWLIAWADGQESLSPTTLEDFWGGSQSVEGEPWVAAAYSKKGKEAIDSFLVELEAALPEPGPPLIAKQKLNFQNGYLESYAKAWQVFASEFDQGEKRLGSREEWQELVAKSAASQGPYLALLDTMVEELEPLLDDEDVPAWIVPIFEFHEIKVQAAAEASAKKAGALARVTRTGSKWMGKLVKAKSKIGRIKRAAGTKSAESELVAIKSQKAFQEALTEIAPVSSSRKLSYKVAAQVYGEEEGAGGSPFAKARSAAVKVRAAVGSDASTGEVFTKLQEGPLRFLWAFVRMETACELQHQWESDVVLEAKGVPNWRQLVLGQGGYGWKFLEGPANPFVGKSLKQGYHAKEALGGAIAFDPSFFAFFNKGTRVSKVTKPNYSVYVKGFPTDANEGAKLPHLTVLEFPCGDEVQSLRNPNVPYAKTFNWSPDNCGDVTLRIMVGDVTLIKKYSGNLGFPRFLYEFRKGSRTFRPQDFPEHEATLRRMGISFIRVTYQFRGHRPVISLLSAGPISIPGKIATCWAQ